MLFGGDFDHVEAHLSYELMDKIIADVQQYSSFNRVQIKYSTVQQYLSGVRQEAETEGIKWPVYKGDLVPYMTNHAEWWSGFFSTDQAMKRRIRDFANLS